MNNLRIKDDTGSMQEMKSLKDKQTSLLVQQEIHWQQRAKMFWLRDGDSNTKFFHVSASARRRTNKIQKLKDENGTWVEETEDIYNIARSYFQNLFSASVGNYDPVLSVIEQRVTREDNDFLLRPFHIDEFKIAIYQMHPDKSPGLDGFNPAIYQKFWHIIGDNVFRACMDRALD